MDQKAKNREVISKKRLFTNVRFSIFVLPLLIGLMVLFPAEKNPTLYLVGDSTMSEKPVKDFPETGWGMPFEHFFKSSLTIENHARNGRSTRTFMEEGRWAKVMKKLNPGDFVIVQFGHNDEVQTKEQSTTPQQFTENLKNYISDTKKKNATPVLMTSIVRRAFDENGNLIDTHKEFADLTSKVAEKTNVAFVDMDELSRELILELGQEKSKFLYLHLEENQHPNYPNGIEDNTHFNELGARRMAEIALSEVLKLDIGLEEHVVEGEE